MCFGVNGGDPCKHRYLPAKPGIKSWPSVKILYIYIYVNTLNHFQLNQM